MSQKIEKNSLSISIIKVLGYNNKEIKKIYLNAISVSVMPHEGITFGFIMKYAMARIEGYIEVVFSISIFAIVIGIGMLTYFAINKLHINKINKIAMSDVLKDRE